MLKDKIKGAGRVAELTRRVPDPGLKNILTPLYYNEKTGTVYAEPGPGRQHVTDLINSQSADYIRRTVNRWLWR